MIIEKISCFPNEGTPQVIAGTPSAGDLVRITTTKDVDGIDSVQYCRYSPSPTIDPPSHPEISRARFDDIFAEAIGEASYQSILDTLAAIAATNPMTDQTAKVKRALRALDKTTGIDYPVGAWKTAPAEGDLTAKFLQLVINVTVQSIPDIEAKVDAGLNNWPTT